MSPTACRSVPPACRSIGGRRAACRAAAAPSEGGFKACWWVLQLAGDGVEKGPLQLAGDGVEKGPLQLAGGRALYSLPVGLGRGPSTACWWGRRRRGARWCHLERAARPAPGWRRRNRGAAGWVGEGLGFMGVGLCGSGEVWGQGMLLETAGCRKRSKRQAAHSHPPPTHTHTILQALHHPACTPTILHPPTQSCMLCIPPHPPEPDRVTWHHWVVLRTNLVGG